MFTVGKPVYFLFQVSRICQAFLGENSNQKKINLEQLRPTVVTKCSVFRFHVLPSFVEWVIKKKKKNLFAFIFIKLHFSETFLNDSICAVSIEMLHLRFQLKKQGPQWATKNAQSSAALPTDTFLLINSNKQASWQYKIYCWKWNNLPNTKFLPV